MSWVKLDDQFSDHPKILSAGPLAGWLYVCGLTYAGRYLTDGFIPQAQVRKLADVEDSAALADRLVTCGLWERVDGGYMIHDYLQYNPSGAEVRAQRDIVSRRKAMNDDPELARLVKQRDGNRCRYCGKEVNLQDRKSDDGGTYDHVIPISQGGDESLGNIVLCCRSCNSKKGARTPEAAGMNLMDAPKQSSRNQAEIKPESGMIPRQPVPVPVPVPEPAPIPVQVVGASARDNARARGGPTAADDGPQDVFDVWERAAGMIGGLEPDSLKAFVSEQEQFRLALPRGSPGADVPGEGWVISAIREASESNRGGRLNLRFVKTILDRWERDGYQSKRAYADGKRNPCAHGGNGSGRPGRDADKDYTGWTTP